MQKIRAKSFYTTEPHSVSFETENLFAKKIIYKWRNSRKPRSLLRWQLTNFFFCLRLLTTKWKLWLLFVSRKLEARNVFFFLFFPNEFITDCSFFTVAIVILLTSMQRMSQNRARGKPRENSPGFQGCIVCSWTLCCGCQSNYDGHSNFPSSSTFPVLSEAKWLISLSFFGSQWNCFKACRLERVLGDIHQ